MEFAISGVEINPLVLVAIGFVVGVLGGFFGVGGSFLAGPALFGIGVPMNYVVGTDLAHIVGKSVVAAKKHRVLGNVDIKLGLLMVLGTVAGVEVGARAIERLKDHANVDLAVGLSFIIVLLVISTFIGWESWRTLRAGGGRTHAKGTDFSAISHFAEAIQRIRIPPMVRLPVSGIEAISLWVILVVAFIGGVFSGFLGGGAGYIRMPMLVYVIGVPTHVAVGTDLFEIVISAGYGTLTHAIKGNVDIMIALVMHTGAAIGAQLGAHATQYFAGPRIRLAFFPLPLIGAAIVAWKLITGSEMG
ncbi:MAG TPA: sulfite exporter TauE/SafE family protein [Gemmatimonadota bacterium]|nr:sulfite exporter TauE/SafE family protein [Gemmatimonadota bacterium]